uniref:Sushi domain-containing protein n=1 Tax=Sinocyclocheilus rhinocerous TaxID=307959 RepID=A0A673KKJ7_9TELE
MSCTAVTCELKSTTFGVKKIKPEGKTIFRAGESVEITCSEKHWLFGTKLTSRSFTCKNNGEWDYEPHVSRPYFWGTMKLGAKQSYSCVSGYRESAEEATCTEHGWKPKPLCAEKCGPPPNISNASTKEMTKDEYNTEETVEYSCFDKYKPDLRHPFSRYLTCEKGEWKGDIYCLKPCIVTVEEMDERGIELRWVSKKKIISPHDEGIDFACQSGKKLKGESLPRQICYDGVMHLPECVE